MGKPQSDLSKQIKRINQKILKYRETFGENSKAYQDIISYTKGSLLEVKQVERKTKNGTVVVPQLVNTKRNAETETQKRELKKMESKQSIKDIKKKFSDVIKKTDNNKYIKVKGKRTKSGKYKAVKEPQWKEIYEEYLNTEETLSDLINQFYEYMPIDKEDEWSDEDKEMIELLRNSSNTQEEIDSAILHFMARNTELDIIKPKGTSVMTQEELMKQFRGR